MGAIAGVLKRNTMYFVKEDHSPSEAFNETVEEPTQSLMPLVAETEWIGCLLIAAPRTTRRIGLER